MIATILISVSVTLWCVFAFALYGYFYLLEVILGIGRITVQGNVERSTNFFPVTVGHQGDKFEPSEDLPIVGESPCSAHSALKRIIQKIIREATDLPELKSAGPTNSLNQENRTYEDLLSTAILNKIISSAQSNISLNSSRANSVRSHRSSSSRRRKLQKDYFFGEETLHNKKKWRHDTDTASVSSLEEWVHSDSSRGSRKYVDRVSLTIKQRIEEVSSSDSEVEVESEENDDAEYRNFRSDFGDGEPNWFLQKRQFRGVSSSPVPVSMLVPDPSNEAKVLIGDKEIDDTSDLSDVPSDYEQHNESIPSVDLSNHLIDSKNLIGGKNSVADFYTSNFSDDEISADSGVKECKYMDEVDSEVLTANKVENNFVADESIASDGSNTERDSEYTEKYGTLPRKISITPSNECPEKSVDGLKKNISESNDHQEDSKEESDEENAPEFTGVYSRREKEKWTHAVDLKNNPYSKENIEKRIKCRNSINSLFGSDYYIRQASVPSGTKKTEEVSPYACDETNIVQKEEYHENMIVTNGNFQNVPVKIEKEKLLLMASPYNMSGYTKQTSSSPKQNSSENSLKESDLGMHFPSEISSDSEVSLVNCYDVAESVVYKKSSANNNEEIQTAEKYFDFESLETSLNPEEEIEQPTAKPRKHVNVERTVETSESNIIIKPELFKPIEVKYAGEEFLYTTPYIITKRSDNTLIKKIYSDPSVRSFALSRRKNLPSTVEVRDLVQKPDVKYEKSSEVSKPLLMKQFSWDTKKTAEKKQTEKKQTEKKYLKSFRSVEDYYSEQKPELNEEQNLIYEKSPELTGLPAKKEYSIDNKEMTGNNQTETKIFRSLEENIINENQEIEKEIHLQNHQGEISAHGSNINSERGALTEINKLKKQKLVASRLKELSKSTFNLSNSTDADFNKISTLNKIDRKETIDVINREVGGSLPQFQNKRNSSSVRDLRKKFEKFHADASVEHPILHSLTGRSISKQFKQKLKDFNGDIPSLTQIHSLSLTNLELEDNTNLN